VITVDSINTRLFRNISLNTLQVLANQFLGVFIFLLLSRYLDKGIYGELNWSLAVLTLMTTILSLRLEQIVVRNVAAGKDPSALLTLFTVHNLVTGSVFRAAAGRQFPVPCFLPPSRYLMDPLHQPTAELFFPAFPPTRHR
jgi:hypothetical protein